MATEPKYEVQVLSPTSGLYGVYGGQPGTARFFPEYFIISLILLTYSSLLALILSAFISYVISDPYYGSGESMNELTLMIPILKHTKRE